MKGQQIAGGCSMKGIPKTVKTHSNTRNKLPLSIAERGNGTAKFDKIFCQSPVKIKSIKINK